MTIAFCGFLPCISWNSILRNAEFEQRIICGTFRIKISAKYTWSKFRNPHCAKYTDPSVTRLVLTPALTLNDPLRPKSTTVQNKGVIFNPKHVCVWRTVWLSKTVCAGLSDLLSFLLLQCLTWQIPQTVTVSQISTPVIRKDDVTYVRLRYVVFTYLPSFAYLL